jgi:bla regulator protein blaR1
LLNDPDDSAGMSPGLAQARNEQRQARHAYLAQLGPVTSFEFLGVSRQGWDKYLVRHVHGTEEMSLLLDSNDTIVSAHRQP